MDVINMDESNRVISEVVSYLEKNKVLEYSTEYYTENNYTIAKIREHISFFIFLGDDDLTYSDIIQSYQNLFDDYDNDYNVSISHNDSQIVLSYFHH